MFKLVTGLLVLFCLVAMFAYPFMKAWNMSIPFIFDSPKINFIQALSLMIVTIMPMWLTGFVSYLLNYAKENQPSKIKKY